MLVSKETGGGGGGFFAGGGGTGAFDPCLFPTLPFELLEARWSLLLLKLFRSTSEAIQRLFIGDSLVRSLRGHLLTKL